MPEITEPKKNAVPAIERRWNPENLTEARLTALLPYTELDSIEEFKTTLQDLEAALAFLPRKDGRHLFLTRKASPIKDEYVLYAARLSDDRFKTIERCLDALGVTTEATLPLDREYVVIEERGKITLELLGLVAGYDVDADEPQTRGANWNVVTQAAMEQAAKEDAADDIPVVQRSHRSFPLRGNARLQALHPELRRHFMESTEAEEIEGDPVELDRLIDDTAARFEDGSLTLDQAFDEWGLEVEEHTPSRGIRVPAGKPLGEQLRASATRKYRWKKGRLYTNGKSKNLSDATEVTTETLRELYAQAHQAAVLLRDADSMERKAERLLEIDDPRDGVEKLRAVAVEKRAQADAMPDSLKAIAQVVDIHRGFVFTRVMRFLKRKDVRTASAFGPHDLMQEGLVGLYRALAVFDPADPRPFIALARSNVDGRMLALAARHRTFVAIPENVQQQLNQLYDLETRADTIPNDGRPYAMSPDERQERRLALAKDIFKIDHGVVAQLDKKYRAAHHESASFQVPISTLDDAPLSEVDMRNEPLHAEPETKAPEILDTKISISRLLTEKLTPREERAIRLRYRIGRSDTEDDDLLPLWEVGLQMGGLKGEGVTTERARQIEGKALRKLKRALAFRYGRRDSHGNMYLEDRVLASIFHLTEKR